MSHTVFSSFCLSLAFLNPLMIEKERGRDFSALKRLKMLLAEEKVGKMLLPSFCFYGN